MKMLNQLIARGDKHEWTRYGDEVFTFINVPEGFAFKKINPNEEIFNHRAVRIDLKKIKKVI